MAEYSLQIQVMKFLRGLELDHDIFSFAVPNEGKRSPKRGNLSKQMGLTAGVADICVMFPKGRVAWIELKVTGGKLNPNQKKFQSTCRALGHSYHLIELDNEWEIQPKLTGMLAAHGVSIA